MGRAFKLNFHSQRLSWCSREPRPRLLYVYTDRNYFEICTERKFFHGQPEVVGTRGVSGQIKMTRKMNKCNAIHAGLHVSLWK